MPLSGVAVGLLSLAEFDHARRLVIEPWADERKYWERQAVLGALRLPAMQPELQPLINRMIDSWLPGRKATGRRLAAVAALGSLPIMTTAQVLKRLRRAADTDEDATDDVEVYRPDLDRWALSRLAATVETVRDRLDAYDATRAGQDFVLRNTPVTYLQDSASRSGENYSSTVRIWVNGVEWHEVQSFYGQPSTAHVFVTYEDAEGKTHVTTGDGINGARLPSGVDNVVASYRYGSGEEAPAAGTLTVVTKSYPGLRSVRNPVAAGGGADPDAASRLRELAPRSVLTFGRAVSAADYEAIALSSPGVDRVRAYWSFNAEEQRAMLTLYVGDEESSADAARTAILGAGESDDAVVLAATRIELEVFMTVVHDPDHDAETVKAAVSAVIFDPVDGVFGSRKSRIGRAVYRSAIHAACLAVPGVVALRELYVLRDNVNWGIWNLIYSLSHRYAPGEGGYFVVNEVTVTMETPDGQ